MHAAMFALMRGDVSLAVARRQGTRSFELRAALALAKLYQSTGRPADAHAVLALALDGFAPTPAMPEIAEAQAAGAKSLRQIAAALNGRGIATARGGKWEAATVAKILKRVAA